MKRLLIVAVMSSLTLASAAYAQYQVVWTEAGTFHGQGLQSSYIGDVDGDGMLELCTGTGLITQFVVRDLITGNIEYNVSLDEGIENVQVVDIDAQVVGGDVYPEIIVDMTNGKTALINFAFTQAATSPRPPVSELQNVFPNPSLGQSTISFSLQDRSRVNLSVFDINGRLVRKLLESELPKGEYGFDWDARDSFGRQVASGTYYYQLQVNGQAEGARKAVLIN